MKHQGDALLAVALQFGLLSLMAIGGVNSLIPEMHRQVVDMRHWMSNEQFGELFAISQAAPGPNAMIVVLIGQQVAGPLGGIVAMVMMCGPSAALACVVARVFDRYREARWRRAIEAGLVPVTVGLVAATALVLTRASDHSMRAGAMTLAAFALTYWTRMSPLLVLAGAAAAGFVFGV